MSEVSKRSSLIRRVNVKQITFSYARFIQSERILLERMDKDSPGSCFYTGFYHRKGSTLGDIFVNSAFSPYATCGADNFDLSEKGVPPPGAAVAYRRILKDPRDEPQYAERVPYLISNADGRRLIDRARMPEELLSNRSLSIDTEYYIRNLLIPPLSRIFNLVGADVEEWYDSMPKTKRLGKYDKVGGQMANKGHGKGKPGRTKGSGSRIDSHFKSSHCVVCGIESADGEPSATCCFILS